MLRLMALVGCLVAFGGGVVSGSSYETRIYCDQVIGSIKPGLAGVAQGGNADSYLKPEVLSAVKDLHIPYVRLEGVTTNIHYELYDPVAKKYNWEVMDREIENIRACGSDVILNIFYMPKWLSNDPEGKIGASWLAAPRDYKLWRKYIGDIVRHVNIDRKFGIKYWEVWNEPSGSMFSAWQKYGPEKFWEFYANTAKAVKDADPRALVGGFGDNGNYPEHLKGFFEYSKSHKDCPIDFLTLHWYGEWPADQSWKRPDLYYQLAQNAARLHRTYFNTDIPIFYTEWNLNAETPNFTPAQQAAFMGSSYFWMQESPITGALFFRVEVYGNNPMTLLNGTYEWRAPARVLKMFTSLPKYRVPVMDPPYAVTVLASKDTNRVAAMLSRFDLSAGEDVLDESVVFLNPGKKGKYTVTTYIEDSTSGERIGRMQPAVPAAEGESDGKTPITVKVQLRNYSVGLVMVEFE